MKSPRFATVALALSALAASTLPAHAQAPANPPAPPVPAPSPAVPPPPAGPGPGGPGGPGGGFGGRGGPGGPGGGMGRRAMENLTPEEQTRVQAARRAIAQDPAVQEARRALMQAERDAMLKQDPTLGPVLDKIRPPGGPGGGGPGRKDGAGAGRGQRNPFATAAPADDAKGLAMLTPEERARLANAQRAARQDPAVVAARQAMQSATSPEARRAARQTMQEALRAAMLRADAGIGAILEKVGRDGGSGKRV